MTRAYFVTGTDTGVGKTLVSAALIHLLAARRKKVIGMKPVASGCRKTDQGLRNDDAEMLIAASTVKAQYKDVNPYAFEPAIAPHLAAEEAGIRIEMETVLDHFERLQQTADTVVVEGVGGWLVPLGHVITTEHMAKTLGLPVILVIGMRLGCLNHALLTARAIEAAGLRLSGWVANLIDPAMERVNDNLHTLEKRLSAPFLGTVPWQQTPDYRDAATQLLLPE
jgi:dethiobiotin synthetase